MSVSTGFQNSHVVHLGADPGVEIADFEMLPGSQGNDVGSLIGFCSRWLCWFDIGAGGIDVMFWRLDDAMLTIEPKKVVRNWCIPRPCIVSPDTWTSPSGLTVTVEE